MADKNREKDKKNEKNKQEVNPVAAGVTGAVVGAGVAVGAAKMIGDKKMQKKAKEVLSSVKDQAMDYIDKVQIREKASRIEAKAKSEK